MKPRVGLLLVLAVSPAGACGPSAEPEPRHGPDVPYAGLSDGERRDALRAELRAELGAAYDESLPEPSADELTRAAEHWELLCANCHGRNGGGTRQLSQLLPISPGDLRDPLRARFFSDRAKLEIVREGIGGTPMIGWKDLLGEAELRALVAHMDTLVVADE